MATRIGPFEIVHALPEWGSGWHSARHVGDIDDELPARVIVRTPLVGEAPFLAMEGARRRRAQRPPCPYLPHLLRAVIEPGGVCLVFEPLAAIRIASLLEGALPAALALGYVDDVARALAALDSARGDDSAIIQLSFEELLIKESGDALVLTPPVGPRAVTPGLLQQPRRDRFLLSPEKLAGESGDARTAEVFMLGALLFMLLTNAEPHGASRSMREIDQEIPDSLDVVVRRALSLDPHERHETVDELRADIARCADQFPPEDRLELVRAIAGHRFQEAEGLLR